MAGRLHEIAAIRLPDGVHFDAGSLFAAAIRDGDVDEYAGVRVRLVGLLGYPLVMVLAEKIVTAIDRGEGNTRWRDFADVYTLTRLHSVEASTLRNSLETVAAYRGVTLNPVLPALAEMPDRAQAKWRAWRTRVNRQKELPDAFTEVLQDISGFADPVLTETANGHWNVAELSWEANAMGAAVGSASQ